MWIIPAESKIKKLVGNNTKLAKSSIKQLEQHIKWGFPDSCEYWSFFICDFGEYINWGYRNSFDPKSCTYKVNEIYMFFLLVYCQKAVYKQTKNKKKSV